MSYDRRHTVQSHAWLSRCRSRRQLGHQLYRYKLEGDPLADLIDADGYWREQQGDTDNARRCYALATEKGHAKAARRLKVLGGPTRS